MKEVTLDHHPGTFLWADALTKALPTQSLSRFCDGIGLGDPSVTNTPVSKEVMSASPQRVEMLKSISLLAAGASLLPVTQAAETCEATNPQENTGGGLWSDTGWLLLLAGLVCLLHIIKDVGWNVAKCMLSPREVLKVKILDDQATLPSRGTEEAAGWDLASSASIEIQPTERKLVPLGIALELPPGAMGGLLPEAHLPSRAWMSSVA